MCDVGTKGACTGSGAAAPGKTSADDLKKERLRTGIVLILGALLFLGGIAARFGFAAACIVAGAVLIAIGVFNVLILAKEER